MKTKFDFPAVHIYGRSLHMNPGAASRFADAQAMRLRVTANAILLEPAPRYGRDTVMLRHRGSCVTMNLPQEIQARNMTGYYKLYKAGPLYAIRRDEKLPDKIERRAG